MTCKDWKPEWVAHLYGELEPLAERELEAHLAHCPTCPETLADLGACREILARHRPVVPETARVVVLRSRRAARPAWAFAVGAACSALVFLLGTASGAHWFSGAALSPPRDGAEIRTPPEGEVAELARSLRHSVETLEQRLAKVEQDGAVQTDAPSQEFVTAQRWQQERERLERRIERDRDRDLDLVMNAIAATEIRTGAWIGQTRDALQYLAVKQDPRFSER